MSPAVDAISDPHLKRRRNRPSRGRSSRSSYSRKRTQRGGVSGVCPL